MFPQHVSEKQPVLQDYQTCASTLKTKLAKFTQQQGLDSYIFVWYVSEEPLPPH